MELFDFSMKAIHIRLPGNRLSKRLKTYIFYELIQNRYSRHTFSCPFSSCPGVEGATSNDLIGHILRSHLQLLIYRDPVSKEKKSMYGCPFCNEAFLWVGKIFSAHIQKHVLGKVVNRSFDFIERMLEVQNSDSEPDAKEVSVKVECMEDGEGDDFTEVINCADGDEGDYDAGIVPYLAY